jgi:hypothetical protein
MEIKYRIKRRKSMFYVQQHMFWFFWADMIMCNYEIMRFKTYIEAQNYIDKLMAFDHLSDDDAWCNWTSIK